MVSVSFLLYEKDFWQHLLVGRVIWEQHRVPTTQLWTWPTYGAPDVNSSWGFRALIWPVWSAAGVWGLFGWRWAVALLALGLGWLAARRMGARGFTPLAVLVLCSLTYRQRSHIRPESLVGVLIALQIWMLETWRCAGATAAVPGSDASHRSPALTRSLGLIAIAWAWANTHLSWFLGFVVLGTYLLDAQLAAWRERDRRGFVAGARAGAMWRVALVALAISLVNPFGWRALWQPFEYFLVLSHEPIFRSIPELKPPDLQHNLANGLPLVLVGWPLLILWRALRARFDRVEAVLCAGFCGLALQSQRFLGFTMVIAAPFLARDLDEWVRARRWPAWTSPPWARAGLAATACVLMGLVEWSRTDLPLGVGIRLGEYPVAACDFMAARSVKGRGFNQFYYGGYLLYRFWPDRERLPFMDIHQAGTPQDRYTYYFSLSNPKAWSDLDRRHRFDYALVRRVPNPGDQLLDILDADSSFALVFADDAAALYVKRDGPLRSLVEHSPYRLLGAGPRALGALGMAVTRDTMVRAQVRRELEREVAGSPYHAMALVRFGSLAMLDGDHSRARKALERAIAIDPRTPRGHERLGLLALAQNRPHDALGEFRQERRLTGWFRGYDLRSGQAWQMLGDRRRALGAYRREAARDPGNQEARDSVQAIAKSSVSSAPESPP